MTTLQILFSVFDLVFDFWPVLLLSPLQSRKRGNSVRVMLVSWSFWAIVRIFLAFNPEPISASLLIPEPLSTILFFVTGVVLGGILLAQLYFKRERLMKKANEVRKQEELVNLSPVEFEEIVVEMFNMIGHQARRTGKSGDHGVDVVVKAKNGEKWIVQCKRWRKAVGEGIIRDFYGTIQHEKAAQGAIIAASGFTQPARKWAKGKPIRLVGGEEFLKMWYKARQIKR